MSRPLPFQAFQKVLQGPFDLTFGLCTGYKGTLSTSQEGRASDAATACPALRVLETPKHIRRLAGARHDRPGRRGSHLWHAHYPHEAQPAIGGLDHPAPPDPGFAYPSGPAQCRANRRGVAQPRGGRSGNRPGPDTERLAVRHAGQTCAVEVAGPDGVRNTYSITKCDTLPAEAVSLRSLPVAHTNALK